MSANPYMTIVHRIVPPMPQYQRRRAPVPRGLMLLLSKALYQIEFKHYSEPKLLTTKLATYPARGSRKYEAA